MKAGSHAGDVDSTGAPSYYDDRYENLSIAYKDSRSRV